MNHDIKPFESDDIWRQAIELFSNLDLSEEELKKLIMQANLMVYGCHVEEIIIKGNDHGQEPPAQ